MKKSFILVLLGLGLGFSACANDFYYEHGEKVEVSKLKETRIINDSAINYYMTSTGHKVGVNNEIIVQCEKNVDCMNVLKKYHLTHVEKLSNILFLVKLVEGEDIFKLSQKLYNDSAIKSAHPNFIQNRKMR